MADLESGAAQPTHDEREGDGYLETAIASDEIVDRILEELPRGAELRDVPPWRKIATMSPGLMASSMSWVTKAIAFRGPTGAAGPPAAAGPARSDPPRYGSSITMIGRVGRQRRGDPDPLLLTT